MDQRLVEDVIYTFQTLRHLVRHHTQTWATLTAHQQGMFTEVLSQKRSLLAVTISGQLKWKFSISPRWSERELEL